jgi:membrane associated rhomboid family serine protease
MERILDDRADPTPQVPGPSPWAEPVIPQRVHEPPLNLAWPAAVLVAVFIALYAVQSTLVDPNAVVAQFGFTPVALLQGGWYQPLTALFVHGSWAHVLFNSAFAVAFGQPVARRFGLGPLGAVLFLLFFLVCGLAGNFAYALVHPNGYAAVVGASGGIAGLLAAASRLMGQGAGGRTGLAPLNSPTVVVMSVAMITLNLVIGLFHLSAGFGSDGAPVAWETHIAGYLAGLLLIDLFVKAAGRPAFQRRKD